MSIKGKILHAQDSLNEFLKMRRFAKANRMRELSIEERSVYTTCYGKLNESLVNFVYTIQSQVYNIRVGEEEHRNTEAQEDALWDAAIGYMLVKDAMYAMDSLYDRSSLEYAYDLLNGVVKYMDGGDAKVSRFAGVRMKLKKNNAKYLTSDEAIKEKEAFLETFFDELKRTGNIDECIRNAHNAEAEKVGKIRFSPGESGGTPGGNPLRMATSGASGNKEAFSSASNIRKMSFRAPAKAKTIEDKPIEPKTEETAETASETIPETAPESIPEATSNSLKTRLEQIPENGAISNKTKIEE